MFLVHNERTKLTASRLNGLATAFIAAGFFAPLAALFYGLTELRIGVTGIVAVGTVCLSGGAFLHAVGWVLLRRLRE
jgi:hypothetical protein